MTNACPAEKPHQGQKNRNRRSRRRKSAASRYRIKEKLRSGPRLASGPHVDYNARLYDPTLGRFLSVDPLIGHPGSTQSINPYSYVENNPLNKVDPTGEAIAGMGPCGVLGDECTIGGVDIQGATQPAQQGGSKGTGGQPLPAEHQSPLAATSGNTNPNDHTTLNNTQKDPNDGIAGSPSTSHSMQDVKSLLSEKSINMIEQQAKKFGYKASDFEKTIVNAADKAHIDPNVLVGMGFKESSLNPFRGNGGLFQIQPALAKDLGIAAKDISKYSVQIPKVANVLSTRINTFHGNQDLAIASWTMGVHGTEKLYASGGMQAVRSAELIRGAPNGPKVGTNYIDVVNSFRSHTEQGPHYLFIIKNDQRPSLMRDNFPF